MGCFGLKGDTISILQNYLLHKYPWKDNSEPKAISVTAHRHEKMWETMENGLLRHYNLNDKTLSIILSEFKLCFCLDVLL